MTLSAGELRSLTADDCPNAEHEGQRGGQPMLPVAKGLPVSRSLLLVADALADPELDHERAVRCVRDAAASIEFHLDTLARDMARGQIEARLLPRAAAVEKNLRQAVIDTWRIDADLRTGVLPLHVIGRLSRQLRHAAEDEIDVVFEQLRDVAAED
jgi:hypothetical protein